MRWVWFHFHKLCIFNSHFGLVLCFPTTCKSNVFSSDPKRRGWKIVLWNEFHERQIINNVQIGLTKFVIFMLQNDDAYASLLVRISLGVSKFSKLGLLPLWRPIISCVDLRLRWGLKQNCSLRQELSNNMLHTIYTHINQGNSWFLVIES